MLARADARNALSNVTGYLTEVLFPPVCPVCRVEVGASGSLCPECWTKVAFLSQPACGTCGRPVLGASAVEPELVCDDCFGNPRNWSRAAAAIRYEGVGRSLVLSLKHGDRLDIVPMLSAWMLRVGGDLVADADLITPVPLHWTRLLKRRYNQSAELARYISTKAGAQAKFTPRILARARRTPSQDGKDRVARTANLKGALTGGSQAARIEGKRVLLVDDVFTTGASLTECTKICLALGASAVDVLVLALVIREERFYFPDDVEEQEHELG